MKLVLLIVAGAFATQDVTPPVISLSFSDNRYASGDDTWRGICHAGDQSKYAHDLTCQTRKTSSTCATGCTAIADAAATYSAAEINECATSVDCSEPQCATKLCEWHSGNAGTGLFGKVRGAASSHVASSSASVMCYVKSTETSCPDPTCSATDHHDSGLQCDDPAVTMIQRNLAASLTKHASNADGDIATDVVNAQSWSTSPKDSTCVDTDSQAATATWAHRRSHKWTAAPAPAPIPDGDGKHFSGQNQRTCVPRSILGQYLVTYGARDASGNEAEKVSFSFLFVDPFVPDLDFTGTTHGSTGYLQRMLFWPDPASESYVTSGAGSAIYDTASLAVVRPTVSATNRNTWGAFYSAWSSAAGTFDPFTLASATFSGTDITSKATLSWKSTEERFNFETSQSPEGFARNSNFEAGDCQSEFGGFLDTTDNGSEIIIKGDAGFCAKVKADAASYDSELLKDGATVCGGKTSGECAVAPKCEWVAGCDRTASTTAAYWDYNLKMSATDNYRDSLTVYYKVDTTDSGTWETGSDSTSHTFCMRPGAPYIVDFIVSDEAGIFGFEHKDNMQTHRIQITVTDNTRPVVKPITYDTITAATDVTTSSKAWMSCAELTHPNLCKGMCSYTTSGNSCAATTVGADVNGAYSCRNPTTKATDCEGYTTQAACWTASKGCVWTRTAKLTRSACDGWDKDTCPNKSGCTLYSFVDRSTLSTSQEAASVLKTGQESYKCRSTQTADAQTSTENADTTIFLECGTGKHAPVTDGSWHGDESNAAVTLRGSVVDHGAYEEHGFQAEDNWDNYDDQSGSCNSAKETITCTPSDTKPTTGSATLVDGITPNPWYNKGQSFAPDNGSGNCHVDNSQLAHADSADGGDHAKDDYKMAAMFGTDYLVSYMYTDSEGNNAWPVTRRVVVKDTSPPELVIRGDCSLENSAGAHTNNDGTLTHASFSCIAKNTMNRFVEGCSNHTDAGEVTCVADTNCKWHQNSADQLNTDGSINTSPSEGEGLFHHDRIAKFFDHRDDCDRHIITIVTLHEGTCDTSSGGAKTCSGKAPSGTCTIGGQSHTGPECTKIDCTAGDKTKCALEIFRWKGQEVHDQTHTTESIFAKGTYEQKFPEYEAGTYAIQYETIDASGLKVTGCRQIENVDHTHPIIQILGSDQMTLEATHQGNYIDDGATCSDQVDGVISQNVEVSGDVVNLSKVGTYTITYNCKDSANNEAPAAQRTVVVAQTSCPKCIMYGEHTGVSAPNDKFALTHEASFPYIDAGATCSDVIDGSVTVVCSSTKDAAHGETAANCATPTNLVDVDKTGTYTITYRAQNTVGLWNDGANCRGGPNTYQRVVEVKDTLRPVITLRYGATGTSSDPLVAQGSINAANTVTEDYDKITGSPYKTNWENKRDARPGTAAERLQYRDFDSSATPSTANDNSAHPLTLMAEQTTSSVNGWVIGAFASAVAGLALLGYSTRRTTVATSVPV